MPISRASLLAALALTACPARTPPLPQTADVARAETPAVVAPVASPTAPTNGLGLAGLHPTEPATPAPTPSTVVGPASPAGDQTAAAQGLNQLGADLYARLRARPGNFALAPASIALAFGMTEAGAHGGTLAEMRHALHATLDEPRQAAALGALSARWNSDLGAGVSARTANRLFGHERFPFEAPYVALTGTDFNAPLERVDFAQPEPARAHINAWVAEQTLDKIRDLIPAGAVTTDTRLVLVNAMYLRAAWLNPFPAYATRDDAFYVGGGAAVQVPTMSEAEEFGYAEAPGFKVVELPYAGGQLAMDVLLPDARDGLAALEAQLTREHIATTLAAVQTRRVLLRLPRFRVSTESFSLRDAMMALGMPTAFDRRRADFTGIARPPSPDDQLYLSDAFHKVFVDVTERGTEAAAATAVVSARGGGAAPPAPFAVDHPFVFIIRDRQNGAVLFMGRVVDPRPSA